MKWVENAKKPAYFIKFSKHFASGDGLTYLKFIIYFFNFDVGCRFK